ARQAVEPIEAGPAQPGRRAGNAAGDEVEDAADAERERNAKGGLVARDPALLSGGAVGDQQNVDAAGRRDGGARLGVAVGSGPAGEGPGDLEAGVGALEDGGGGGRDAGLGAEQEE